jgi:hypothetical protein
MEKIKTIPYYQQIKVLILVVLCTFIPFIVITIIGMSITGLSGASFTRDPLVIAELPAYIGLFSNIGVLIWCSCVNICFGTYLILKQKIYFRKYADFLLWSGILTFVLMIDDFFMLHEAIGYFHIPEYTVYIIYIIITARIIAKNKHLIAKTEFIILSGAILFLGLSVVWDTIGIILNIPINIFLEDTFKILGITCWFTYFARLSFQQIKLFIEYDHANIIY